MHQNFYPPLSRMGFHIEGSLLLSSVNSLSANLFILLTITFTQTLAIDLMLHLPILLQVTLAKLLPQETHSKC